MTFPVDGFKILGMALVGLSALTFVLLVYGVGRWLAGAWL